MRANQVIAKLEELSPVSYASDWDNVGLLVGRRDKDVESVFIALDATVDVIEDAISKNADMLITHHPMIFKGIKNVRSDDFIGKRVISLIKADIAYYAMHTNFDVMGMADAVADELSLQKSSVLKKTYEDDISSEGLGRFGMLKRQMTLRECAEYVKSTFHIPGVRVFGDLEADVLTAAICPGSGGSMIDDALNFAPDVYITGDIDHHEGIDAVARGMNVIDAGHYGLEKIFVPYMKEYIERECKGIKVYTMKMKEPFVII